MLLLIMSVSIVIMLISLWYLINYKREPPDKTTQKEWEYWKEARERGNPKIMKNMPPLSIKDHIMIKLKQLTLSRAVRKKKQKTKVKNTEKSPIKYDETISLDNLIDGELPDEIYTDEQHKRYNQN